MRSTNVVVLTLFSLIGRKSTDGFSTVRNGHHPANRVTTSTTTSSTYNKKDSRVTSSTIVPPLFASTETSTSSSITIDPSTSSSTKSNSMNSFTDDELIEMTKKYVFAPDFDYIRDVLADDFVFRGPVIGPLCKDDYLSSVTALVGDGDTKFYGDVIQDYQLNAFGFSVDPVESNRVWYFVRERGVFGGDFNSPSFGTVPATGKKWIAPPEARSVLFDKNGKVRHYTVGYATDRFSGDNTNGKGAIFGALHTMGIDIPGEPGNPITGFIQWLGTEVLKNGGAPSWSSSDKIPSWWKDERKGNQLR